MINLRDIEAFVFDMDGVLYRVDTPIPGAIQFLQLLQDEGTPFLLLTNNSTLTPEMYVSKLAKMGIAIEPEDILTSSLATADYLKSHVPAGTRVYVVGEEGILQAVRDAGCIVTDEDPEYVVVGFDRQVTYEKLAVASLAIRNGATYIATNSDVTLPSEKGLLPGCGAILAAITTATEVSPLVIGKPQREMFDQAVACLGTTRSRTAMVGDRMETDIVGAENAGLLTILLLSGATTAEDIVALDAPADFVFRDIAVLLEAWREEAVSNQQSAVSG